MQLRSIDLRAIAVSVWPEKKQSFVKMPKNSKFGGFWWWPGWWKWSKTRDHLHWARRPGQPPLILNFTPNFSWSCAPQFNKLTWLTSLIWDPDNFPPFDERPREACRKKLCTWMGFAKKNGLSYRPVHHPRFILIIKVKESNLQIWLDSIKRWKPSFLIPTATPNWS